jgi:hypothetical protein
MARRRAALTVLAMAAVFNLNHHASYLHWHFINLSVSNVILIGVMLAVFVLAIVLPFPHHEGAGGER